MDYKAEIIIREDPENIQKCILPEKINRERSSLKVKMGKEGLIVEIEAKDAVAFRASMNALTQALAVYAKSKKV